MMNRQTDRQTIPDRQNKNLNGLVKPTTKQEVKWLMRNEKNKTKQIDIEGLEAKGRYT